MPDRADDQVPEAKKGVAVGNHGGPAPHADEG